MPDIKEQLLTGHETMGRSYKVHLDGDNQLNHLSGEQEHSRRQSFFSFTDDGDLACVRFDSWKLVFLEQRAQGILPFVAELLATFVDHPPRQKAASSSLEKVREKLSAGLTSG